MPISYGFLPPSLPVAGLEIPPDAHSDGERFRMQPFFSHPPPGSITPLDDSGDDFPPAQGGMPPRAGFSPYNPQANFPGTRRLLGGYLRSLR